MEIKRKIASIRTSTHVSSASQRASFGTNQNILEIQLYAMINVWHFCNGNVLCRRGKKTSPKRQRSNFRLVGAFIPKFITWVIMQFNIIERFWLVFLTVHHLVLRARAEHDQKRECCVCFVFLSFRVVSPKNSAHFSAKACPLWILLLSNNQLEFPYCHRCGEMRFARAYDFGAQV